MLTPTEVVVLFPARVTSKTGLRNFFRRLVLEGDDLFGVAFLDVSLAWSMTRLATRHVRFPACQVAELCVTGMGEVFELVLVAILAGVTTHVVATIGMRRLRLSWRLVSRNGPRVAPDRQPHYRHT